MTSRSSSLVSALRRRWAAWCGLTLTFRIGVAIIVAHVLLAIFGPIVIAHDPAQIGTGAPLAGPSLTHLFGVDQLGRDVFSRAVSAGRVDIALAFFGTLGGLVTGSLLGLFSGYMGGPVDEVLQRLNETLISIPFLIFALLLFTVLGPYFRGHAIVVVLVLTLIYMPRVSRMARSAAIEIASRDFITVARLRGQSPITIMWRELAPNATGVLLVEFAIRAGYAPILVGTLGFLGFGVRPPTPEWGLMISSNRNLLLVAPHTVLGPGLMLTTFVIGLNLFTEGLARIMGRTVRVGDV
jgi:peptide/nickel transport system permease protein